MEVAWDSGVQPQPTVPCPFVFLSCPRRPPHCWDPGQGSRVGTRAHGSGVRDAGSGGGRRAQGKLELPAGPRGRPQKVMLKVVAGPDGGGGVRDSGERSLEQIKGGLQGGGLQGAGREEMRPEPRCRGANAKRGAQEAAGSAGTVVLGAAWLLFGPLSLHCHPAQAPECPPWSGQRGPIQQPSPCPTQHRPGGPRFQAGIAAGQGPRSLAECRCVLSQPLYPQPGSAAKSWEGGMLPNGKHELRTPAPHRSPRVLPCLPAPTPTPGMVLSTADQDFMVQKPPEGKGRRGHWRPPPPARLAASLCVRGGKGWPAEGWGAHPGERWAAAPLHF